MRRYRNLFHRAVEGIDPGKEGSLELTAGEEDEYLRLGRLEIVPQEYEVVGVHAVFGAAPGSNVTVGIPLGQEQILISAGHLTAVSRKRKADREG